MSTTRPIVIIGAGPVGLAAASHLLERGESPLVLEARDAAGAAVREWQHVRLFSPWRYNVDAAARRLLRDTGWTPPPADDLPTGRAFREQYLLPLAENTPLRDHIRYGARVTAVGRRGHDKMKDGARTTQPFVLKVATRDGVDWIEARAVIDASGTWFTPNPIGAGGIAVPGEDRHADAITYGIPDVLGADREQYAGVTTTVVGSGHSSMQVVLDLVRLRDDAPDTRIVWVMRSASLTPADFGGGDDDALPARGALGQHAYDAIQQERVRLMSPFRIQSVTSGDAHKLSITGDLDGASATLATDQVVATTGFRPDLEMLREVRTAIDPVTESVHDLAPMIDPNVHSCGTVPPHGVNELTHPENDFFIAGMKSYGRAPTFLLATGYEQVRSIAAHLTGDHEAAQRIELNLPETGVCSAPAQEPVAALAASCCPPAQTVDAVAVSPNGCCA